MVVFCNLVCLKQGKLKKQKQPKMTGFSMQILVSLRKAMFKTTHKIRTDKDFENFFFFFEKPKYAFSRNLYLRRF